MIPVLLLKGAGLYKTVRFKDASYIGDPLNTMRIFNEKEVDEICVLDIGASSRPEGLQPDRMRDIASESFMPLSYGGGIRKVDDVRAIFKAGIEKIVLNRLPFENPDEVRRIVAFAGGSGVVASIDVRRNWLGRYGIFTDHGAQSTKMNAVEAARSVEAMGVGEILLTAIDRDGTMEGYDLELISAVSAAVSVPVIACGGGGTLAHMAAAMSAGASAAAAGSMFVYQGKHRAVLISYPAPGEIEALDSGQAPQ